jgi:excisionase family DNA binding protein
MEPYMQKYDNLVAEPILAPPSAALGGLMPLLLSVSQAAEALGVSESTVRQLMNNGLITYVQVGTSKRMIPRAALQQFIDIHMVKACPAETTAIVSASSKSAAVTTSFGVMADGARSAAQVQKTVERLKLRSRTLSGSNPAG